MNRGEHIYRMQVTTWSGSDAIETGPDSGKAAAIVKERRTTREPDTQGGAYELPLELVAPPVHFSGKCPWLDPPP